MVLRATESHLATESPTFSAHYAMYLQQLHTVVRDLTDEELQQDNCL
jgi:hypothetical protein